MEAQQKGRRHFRRRPNDRRILDQAVASVARVLMAVWKVLTSAL